MIRTIHLLLAAFILTSCTKEKFAASTAYDCHFNFTDSSASNPANSKYRALLNDITGSGVVGISMSVYTPAAGMWLGAAGKADLHNNIDMQPCNITRVGSTVKMFTATTVLLLEEEGKLNLDDKIAAYLQGDKIDKIENADQATIRQLLQHSSGIYNYIQDLKFQTASLNDLTREWKADDLLQYAYGRKAYFAPGQDVRYSNTGYILLGLMIEKVEGKPLYQVFDEKIIHPLGLASTHFAAKDPVPANIVRGYVDLYSNLNVTESTYYSGWDYYTADGGLISNPYDMNRFIRALFNGELVTLTSLNKMLDFKTPNEPDAEFFPITYGLGLFKIETPYGTAIMHSGDAIGYYANVLYFPADKTTIVYAVNSNYGKIDEFVSTRRAMEKVIRTVKD